MHDETTVTNNALSDLYLSSNALVLAVWVTVATSSIVLFEPAIYDVFALSLFVTAFAAGLRLPVDVGVPLSLLTLFLIGNIVASVTTVPTETIRSLFIRFMMVMNWLLFASLVYHSPQRLFRTIWSGYVIASLVATVVGLASYAGVPYLDFAVDIDRVRGTFKDANVFGPFLIPPAIYLVWTIERSGVRRSLFSAAVVLLLALGILLSFSRGAWIACFISFTCYALIRLRLEGIKARVIVSATLCVLVAALVLWGASLSDGGLGDTFTNRFTVSQSYDSERFSSQQAVISLAPTTPLGIGPSRSSEVLPLGVEPHNIYLHVLIESGWLGAFGFYSFIILTMLCGYSTCLRDSPVQRNAVIVFCSLCGLLAQSLFIDSTHWRHFYLLLGLMWGAILYSRQEWALKNSEYYSLKGLSDDY